VSCNFSIVSVWADFVKLEPYQALKPSPGWSWRHAAAVPRNHSLANNFRDREHFRGGVVSNIMETWNSWCRSQ
jgi:hypothetical protein